MVKHEKTPARTALLIASLLVTTLIGALVIAGTAGAKSPHDPYDPYAGRPTDVVYPNRITKGQVHPAPLGKNSSSSLPFTGGDIVLFAVTGVAAVATGVVFVRRSRARRGTPS